MTFYESTPRVNWCSSEMDSVCLGAYLTLDLLLPAPSFAVYPPGCEIAGTSQLDMVSLEARSKS